MSQLLFILLALVVLGVIIMVHEFGHYFVGRRMGIGVVEFSVGMGPKILGWTKNGTRYSLRAIPLGGYCSFLGEDEKNDDPRAMNNQPAWKRFLTVLAGPAFNFLLAVVIAVWLISGGLITNPFSDTTHHVIASVEPGMPAEKAGFQPGDVIVEMNGEPISEEEAGMQRVQQRIREWEPGQTMRFVVLRGEEKIPLTLEPMYVEAENRLMIGVSFALYYPAYDMNALEAVPEALRLTGKTIVATVDFLKDLIVGLFRGEKMQEGAVTGVVGIVDTLSTDMRVGFSDAFSSGVNTILYWIFVISMNLGIMNLLPIPALDGGRLLFIAVEAVRGKPIDRNREGMVHLIGFAILIVLMVFVTYSDIRALIQ